MIKTFTPIDVIRYVYNETSPEEGLLIEQALLTDDELLQFGRDLQSLQRDLDRLCRPPSDRSVQNILDFSRSYK